MLLRSWDRLPKNMKNDDVRKYYDILSRKTASLLFKRILDFILALIMLIVLSPIFLIVAIWVKCDSKGSVFFRQERVTHYGKIFHIIKFRTMVQNAETIGSQVTVDHDSRVTRAGHFLRKTRLDELPQLFNILSGSMSFVGTRPEVMKYVKCYTPEMMATLLLPAGVTSLTSIKFKDEEKLLKDADDADKVYVEDVLPLKMKINLEYTEKFNIFFDLKVMFMTVIAVLK